MAAQAKLYILAAARHQLVIYRWLCATIAKRCTVEQSMRTD